MKRPIVWGAAAWTAGSAVAYALPDWRATLALVLVLIGLAVGRLLVPFRGRHALTIVLIGCAACAYFRYGDGTNRSVIPDFVADGSAAVVAGTIVSPVEVDGDRATFVLKAKRLETEGASVPLAGVEKLQVSIRLLEQDDQAIVAGWERGDAAVVAGTLLLPSEARNFGAFDYRAYLHRQHIHWQLTAKGVVSVDAVKGHRWDAAGLLRTADRLRAWLGDRIDVLFPPSQAGYMKGLLLGLRDDFDPEQYARFSRLGLTHVLAISGLHVAVFVGCFVWVLRRFGLVRETVLLTAMWTLPFYILLTGASPSVVRAGLMTMLALWAARKQLLSDGLHLVCIVGWAMLLWNPYYLLDVGFQLSFLVTIGLIVGVSRVGSLLPVRSAVWRGALAVTIVSQLVSFPLTIYYFNQYSILSWPANLLLVPLISFIVTPVGSAALLLGALSPALGGALAWPVVWLNGLTFGTVETMESWRKFQMVWPTPPLWWLLAYFGLLALLLRLLERRHAAPTAAELAMLPPAEAGAPPLPQRRKGGRSVACCVAAAVLLLLYAYKPALLQRGEGLVQVIDVGQGDAILIRTPEGKHVLVDGGGTLSFRKPGEEWKRRANEYEVGAKLLVPLLKQRGVHRLDFVVVSHEDADHIGGLQAVVEQLPVSRLLYNGTLKPGGTAERLFRTAIGRGVSLHTVQAGDVIRLDRDTELQVLYPVRADSLVGQQPVIEREAKQNGVSVVFLLVMSGARLLFTGDMEQAAEQEVLRRLKDDNAAAGHDVDVLKVAHHGSKTSTGDDWLSFWQPRLAVISVGARNSYGHPSPIVTERLALHQVPTKRTDLDGEVQIRVSRSGQLGVRTKLPP
ncbi:ComEC/Rec2 family competence protein [Paenibacillus cymbidii]|uniref:ComEC/Rec2 family competence protein n=1 Tax=Paenibacillus cymbidii TaxID=1639034 RepID=UPI001081DDF7|nr:ComEC/Rec2 family competence protein [Paenibacillus cymbidii]